MKILYAIENLQLEERAVGGGHVPAEHREACHILGAAVQNAVYKAGAAAVGAADILGLLVHQKLFHKEILLFKLSLPFGGSKQEEAAVGGGQVTANHCKACHIFGAAVHHAVEKAFSLSSFLPGSVHDLRRRCEVCLFHKKLLLFMICSACCRHWFLDYGLIIDRVYKFVKRFL